MKIGLAAAVVAAMAGSAMAQTTGVSHPENVPITAPTEVVQPPVVYEAPASRTLMKPSATVSAAPVVESFEQRPVSSAVNPDAMIVGDDARPVSQADLDAGIVARIAGPSNELPVGTLVKVRMAQELTTKDTVEGAEFTAELTEPVLRDGRVLLPAGSVMNGRVTDVHGGRRISGAASIHLQPLAITLPDGTRYKMVGQVVDTDRYKQTKVDDEGTILRRDHKLATGSMLGLATGSGAAAGAVFGGWPGALIGGAVGAGIGTAVWLKQDRQEELPAGTKIVFALTSRLMVGIE